MNKLYLLILWTCMSCHSDISPPQHLMKGRLDKTSTQDFIRNHLDSILWKTEIDIGVQSQISESIYYTTTFDVDACIPKYQSHSAIDTYYDKKNVYFVSSQLSLLRAHSLEYFDIDDYHALIEKPTTRSANYHNYSFLKIPLNSNIECIYEVAVILVYIENGKQDDNSHL